MFKSKRLRLMLVMAGLLSVALAWAATGLSSSVKVVYDENGVPTIRARTELDAIFTQGYLHAKDRFFQMDYQRRAFSGTLAELFGPSLLPQDVQLRTLGLRRAAERSLAVQTPESMAWLQAYSDGVNAYLTDGMYGSADEDSDCSGDSSDYSSSDDSYSSSDLEVRENDLPPEYAFLETDGNGIAPWTPLDSLTMAKGLAFNLSFGLEDIDQTFALLAFRGVGDILGFNGLQLYLADLYPIAPFDPTVSILSSTPGTGPEWPDPVAGNAPGQIHDMMGTPGNTPGDEGGDDDQPLPDYLLDPNLITLLANYREAVADIPMLQRAMEHDHGAQGSNWFVASGALTASGSPMIANDPHLALDTPATFYEAHLQVRDGINVTGVTFPGVPGVVQGCNDTICWGSTVNPMDVTDVYQEVLIALGPNPLQPTHIYRADGPPEPLQFIPQQFLFNAIGDGFPNTLVDAMIPPEQGGVTIIVPRRNNGPIVQVIVDPGPPLSFTGISVQYVGWSATQELETFRLFARAESTTDFEEALQYFDFGSQNWGYADVNGNIAYYTSGELPIREDLQNPPFVPAGLQPPYFIRDGTHTLKHDWQPLTNPQPNQALGTEILPFAEMPQTVNPIEGYILNANNDPIGTTLDGVPWNEFRMGFNGRLYLSGGYAPGFRIGRIQQMIDAALADGPLTEEQFKTIQANNQLLDAEVLLPFLLDAFNNATTSATPALIELASDPAIVEAIGRLGAWDLSTPTGIPNGFDPGDTLPLTPPSQAEIDSSVAATIYSTWRGQTVQRIVDKTLATLPIPLDAYAPGSSQAMVAVRRLLEAYPVTGGVGQSLLNFFNEPGGGAGFFDRRDLVLLRSLRNALDLLASDEFAPAFANSTEQDDYRWGKLHRLVLDHVLGGPLSIPPPGSPGNVAPDLPGFARAGGMGAVDASSHSARSDGLHEFMFGSGPNRRLVATMTPQGPEAVEVIPGGQSGIPGDPLQVDQLLNLWLINDFHPLPLSTGDVFDNAVSCETFVKTPYAGSMEPYDPVDIVPEDLMDPHAPHDLNEAGDNSRSDRRSLRRMTTRGR
jgi:penicillin amidase